MFLHSAAYYDLIYRELKDYADEAAKIDTILRTLEPRPLTLLDVGCGTGEHARILSQRNGYEIDGVDLEPGFVEIARRKVPEARFEVADMRDFDMGRAYDCLLCLFSSIGYVETETGLRSALRCMAAHMEPGGTLVCEPWIRPEEWTGGLVDQVQVVDPKSGEQITRTRVGETDGAVSVLHISYEIVGDYGFRHLSETHRLGLFSKEQMDSAFEAAGFAPRWLPVGLGSSSLVIARREF